MIISSTVYLSSIIEGLEKSFHTVVIINEKLHENVKQNIIMQTKKKYINKSNLFVFPHIHPLISILVFQVMSILFLPLI